MDMFLYDNSLCHEKVNEWSDMWFTRHSQDFYHLSPQNVISLKEFETTTREIGLIIYWSANTVSGSAKVSGSADTGRHCLLLQFHLSY